MSCCGSKRNSIGSIGKATAPAVADVRPGPFAAPAGAAARGPEFEYIGGNVLTVTGQATGLQYRFVGHSARATVDPRDRASLARVPQLRERMSK
jgi:hypothetical protein